MRSCSKRCDANIKTNRRVKQHVNEIWTWSTSLCTCCGTLGFQSKLLLKSSANTKMMFSDHYTLSPKTRPSARRFLSSPRELLGDHTWIPHICCNWVSGGELLLSFPLSQNREIIVIIPTMCLHLHHYHYPYHLVKILLITYFFHLLKCIFSCLTDIRNSSFSKWIDSIHTICDFIL